MERSENNESGPISDGTEELAKLSPSWCLTKSQEIVCPFVWAIENFSFYLAKDDSASHRSAMFLDPTMHPREWYLTMECRKKGDKDRQALFTIRMTAPEPVKVNAKIKFSFHNASAQILIDKESEDICVFSGNDQGWSWNIPHKFLVDIVKEEQARSKDKFIVQCQVTILSEPVNLASAKRKHQFYIPPCRFMEDFCKLYRTGKYADLTVSVAGTDFAVHKMVLASRCPVFGAMFDHENFWKENVENKIVIEDIKAEVFELLLRFIYFDNIEDKDKLDFELLIAANKYGLERLKAMCEEVISASVTVESAGLVLAMADLHNASQLKEFTIEYIHKHAFKVLKSEAWKKHVKPVGALVSEVFTKLVEKTNSFSPPTKQQRKMKSISTN